MNSFFRSKAFIVLIASFSFVRFFLFSVSATIYFRGLVFGLFIVTQLFIWFLYLIFTICAVLIISKTIEFRKYESALKALLLLGIAIMSINTVAFFIDLRRIGYPLRPLEILWNVFSIVVPIFQFWGFDDLYGIVINLITTIIHALLITAIIILKKNGEIEEKGFMNLIPSASMWNVRIPGQPETPVDTTTIQNWVKSGFVSRNTMITEVSTGYSYAAHQIPGLFSSKSYVTALLLSFFFGVFGVDRFYLGHAGVGLAKLFTLGGLGIWALIDFILIASKNVKDSQGLPLI